MGRNRGSLLEPARLADVQKLHGELLKGTDAFPPPNKLAAPARNIDDERSQSLRPAAFIRQMHVPLPRINSWGSESCGICDQQRRTHQRQESGMPYQVWYRKQPSAHLPPRDSAGGDTYC
jgi:hypothetical protein